MGNILNFMKKNHFKFIFGLIIFVAISLSAKSAFAADFIITNSTHSASYPYEITISVDPQSKNINTVEGDISYNTDELEFAGINKRYAIIGAWVESPYAHNGRVSFAGIIPSGFNGLYNPLTHETGAGELFTIGFRVKKDISTTKFKSTNGAVYLHDGKGTMISINDFEKDLNVPKQQAFPNYPSNDKDNIAPEPFFIYVVPSKFLGKDSGSLLVFSANDFQSGISHYEMSVDNDDWVEITSPYENKKEISTDRIRIRALDLAGNSTIGTFSKENPPVNQIPTVENKGISFLYVIILILILIIIYLIVKKYRLADDDKND